MNQIFDKGPTNLRVMKYAKHLLYKKLRDKNILTSQLLDLVPTCRLCDRRLGCNAPVSPSIPIPSMYSGVSLVGRDPTILEDLDRAIFHPDSPSTVVLDHYLRALGVSRSEAHLTNAVYCRGADGRKPTEWELRTCSPLKAYEFLGLDLPVKHLILMGDDAVRQFLGDTYTSIVRCVGYRHLVKIGDRDVSLLVVYHPGFVVMRRELYTPMIELLQEYKQRFMT